MKKIFKTKKICNNDKPFLRRLSIYFGKKSLKFHWITDDDVKAHTHPWDFTSLILFGGYKEFNTTVIPLYKEFGWLDLNEKKADEYHRVELRRFFGIKVPTLTVGWYGEKKQLCSLCKEAGYCLSNKK